MSEEISLENFQTEKNSSELKSKVITREDSFWLVCDDPDKIPGDRKKLFLGKRVKKDVFRVERKPDHYYKKYQGFGLNINLLEKLRERHVERILIRYNGKESKEVYRSRVSDWFENGEKIKNEIKPNDLQFVLPCDEMELIKEKRG